MASHLVSQHQLSAYASPIDGQAGAAVVVLGNDNTTVVGYNGHDSDATIHVQDSSAAVFAATPAGTAGRKWMTNDTGAVYFYYDTGSVWVEVNYLRNTGGTVTGNLSIANGYLDISPNTSHAYNSFALKGRDLAQGSAVSVPYFVPTGTDTDKRMALDLLVKGTPTDTILRGVAWIDITDTNEAAAALGNYEALSLGKFISGYGHVSAVAGGTGTVRPLALQIAGSYVTVGVASTFNPTNPFSPTAGGIVTAAPINTLGVAGGGLLSLGRLNTSLASPSAVVTNDLLGGTYFGGYDSATYVQFTVASIIARATENWSATARGTKLAFTVVPNTTAVGAVAMEIGQDKSLSVVGAVAVGNAAVSASTALITPASTTTISSFRLPHGAAPTSPVDGDVWTTTAGMFVRVNGATVGPLS